MSKPLENPRRIVTGYDAQGKAMVVIDEPVVMEEIAGTKYRRGASWIVNSFPPNNQDDSDLAEPKISTMVKQNGASFYYLDIPPKYEGMMHFTQSLDLAVVIKGEVENDLPDGTKTVVKAGDSFIQRGVIHALSNRHETEWARLMILVVQAQKVTFQDGKGIEGLEFK